MLAPVAMLIESLVTGVKLVKRAVLVD